MELSSDSESCSSDAEDNVRKEPQRAPQESRYIPLPRGAPAAEGKFPRARVVRVWAEDAPAARPQEFVLAIKRNAGGQVKPAALSLAQQEQEQARRQQEEQEQQEFPICGFCGKRHEQLPLAGRLVAEGAPPLLAAVRAHSERYDQERKSAAEAAAAASAKAAAEEEDESSSSSSFSEEEGHLPLRKNKHKRMAPAVAKAKVQKRQRRLEAQLAEAAAAADDDEDESEDEDGGQQEQEQAPEDRDMAAAIAASRASYATEKSAAERAAMLAELRFQRDLADAQMASLDCDARVPADASAPAPPAVQVQTPASTAAEQANADEWKRSACVVCGARPAEAMCEPCGHVCACGGCWGRFGRGRCPVCRGAVRAWRRVYM